MVDPSALSIVMTMFQGRNGYGNHERITGEGFADLLNLSAGAPSFAEAAPEKPSLPVGFAPRQSVSVIFPPAVPREALPAGLATAENGPDMDAVVIPAGAKGQDDLIALIAQLLGQEENGGFLRALSSLVCQIMPEGELEAPVTLKGLDELLQKLCDLLSEQRKPPRILIPLFALFLFPPALPVTPDSRAGQGDGTPPAEAAADFEERPAEAGMPPQGLWPGAGEADAPQETAPAKDVSPPPQAAPVRDAAPPLEAAPLPETAPPLEAAPLPETAPPLEAAPARDAAPPPETSPAQTPDAAPDWAEDVLSAVLSEKPEAKAPEAREAFGRDRIRLAAVAPQETEAPEEAPGPAAEIRPERPEPQSRASDNPEREENAEQPPDEPLQTKTETPSGHMAPAAPAETAPIAETAQAPPGSPVREAMARGILEQIAQSAAGRQAGTTLTMELAPKFLGRISLVLTAAADGVTAKIRSENDAVRSILSANMEALRASLKDAGISMKNIEIGDSRIGWDLARGQAGGMQWGSGHRNHYDFNQNGPESRTEHIPGGLEGEVAQSAGSFYRTGRLSALEYDDTVFDYRA